MRTLLRLLPIAALGLCALGCSTTIPARLEVRDVTSGRTYQTYETWGEVTKGVGYEFTDIETGRRVNLTSYELKTLEGKKSVANDSPEAQTFEAAAARGGIKK